MKRINKLVFYSCCIFSCQLLVLLASCTKQTPPTEQKPTLTLQQMAERGKYLVNIGGCNDCHSPKIMTAAGPEVDSSRLLSGSPSDMKLPVIDPSEITPGKWYLASRDLTSWVGPWGISFAANLSPDSATGSDTWTEELFIKMLRTGKFMGVESGRPIMPPMPWQSIRNMTDEDLKCIFTYLQTLPPIRNSVNAYVPPNEIMNVK